MGGSIVKYRRMPCAWICTQLIIEDSSIFQFACDIVKRPLVGANSEAK